MPTPTSAVPLNGGPELSPLSAESTTELYRALVQHARDAILFADADGRYVDANPAATELTGYSVDELRQLTVRDLTPPDRLDAFDATWKTFEEHGTMDGEYVLLRKDGTTVEVEFRAIANVLPGVHASILHDVTRRKNALRELDEQRELLRDFVENATIGMHWVGPDGTILWANQAELDLLGYTAEEYVGRNVAAFYEDADAIETILRRLSSGEELHNVEARLLAKDGSVRHVLISSNVYWRDGQFVHTRCFTRDISERKRAETAREILVKASEVVSSSLDWRQTLANVARAAVPEFATWCAIDMLTPEEALERVAVAHIDPEKVRWAREIQQRYPVDMEAAQGLPQVLRSGKPELYSHITQEMLRAGARDEEHFRLMCEAEIGSAIIVPIVVQGEVQGTVSFIHRQKGAYDEKALGVAQALADRAGAALENARLYTEVRSLNEELEHRVRERTEALQAAIAELEGFTYHVSHDLKGPLRAIMSTSMILQEDYGEQLSEDARDQLQRQAQAAKRMGQLIEDLLRLSRINRHQIEKEPVDLSQVVEELIQERCPDCPRDIRPGLTAEADPRLVRLLLQNLVENALKFTCHKAPQLAFGRTAEGAFFLRDNGIGFEPDYAEKIFLPFERLHLHSEYPGTGIGLANARRIVSRHGGKIWAESPGPGQGATFYFTLP